MRQTEELRLTVDWTACAGHGLCAELLPERVTVDEWGYPVVDGRPLPPDALRRARRAATDCPVLALHLGRATNQGAPGAPATLRA